MIGGVAYKTVPVLNSIMIKQFARSLVTNSLGYVMSKLTSHVLAGR